MIKNDNYGDFGFDVVLDDVYHSITSRYRLDLYQCAMSDDDWKYLIKQLNTYRTICLEKGGYFEAIQPDENNTRNELYKRGLLSVADLQQYLNIGRTKAYTLANSGDIRTIKIGSKILFDKADVDDFIERSKR